MVQIANEVVCKGRDRRVALCRIFLERLCDDPVQIATMGRCAAEFANAAYSLPTMLRSLDALYSSLLEKKVKQVSGAPGGRRSRTASAGEA